MRVENADRGVGGGESEVVGISPHSQTSLASEGLSKRTWSGKVKAASSDHGLKWHYLYGRMDTHKGSALISWETVILKALCHINEICTLISVIIYSEQASPPLFSSPSDLVVWTLQGC